MVAHVYAPTAAIESWATTAQGNGRTAEVFDVPTGDETIRDVLRGETSDFHRDGRRRRRLSARREWREARRAHAKPAFEKYRKPPPPVVPPSIWWAVAALGVGGAMKWAEVQFGMSMETFVDLVGPSLGAVIGTDAFGGTDGDEVDGRSLDTGGETWDCNGTLQQEINNNGVRTDGGTNDMRKGITDGTAIGDQYAETLNKTEFTISGPVVRGSSTSHYFLRGNRFGDTAWLYDGTLYTNIGTQIAEEIGVTPAPAIGLLCRLEIVGSDLEGFWDGTSVVTATDTTHTTGVGGQFTFGTDNNDSFEWGDLAAAGGGPPVVHHSYRRRRVG